MFDRCWLWRRRLSRQADGTLPPAQLGALQDHLAHCQRCRMAAQADDVLSEVLRTHTGLLDSPAAQALEDRVLTRVFAGQTALVNGHRGHATPLTRGSRRAASFVYLVQIIGGGFTAAAMTALLLAPTLHPASDGARMRRSPANIDRSEPPIPLGSLLQTTTPRAALLWTTPPSLRRSDAPQIPAVDLQQAAPAKPSPPPRPTRDKERHTMLDSSDIMGS